MASLRFTGGRLSLFNRVVQFSGRAWTGAGCRCSLRTYKAQASVFEASGHVFLEKFCLIDIQFAPLF